MSGVGAFIAGAAIGAVVAKNHQKHKNQHHQHYQTSRTVVVHQPPHQVPQQTHVVYVNKPSKHHHGYPQAHPPHGYPQGQPSHGYPQGQPSHGYPQGQPSHGYPQGQPSHGYPQGHPPYQPPPVQPQHGYPQHPPHYSPPQPQSTQVYHIQNAPTSPGNPPSIGFVGAPSIPQGPPPPSSYPSAYPPQPAGAYPPAPQYDGYPPQQGLAYPSSPSGYPSNGYPPMPSSGTPFSSAQYPPPAPHLPPSVCPFQPPSALPQQASAAPAQTIQAQVTVNLTSASNQQTNAGSRPAARPDRRCFVIQNEETRYALQVDTVSGSKLVMRQRMATGSWDPQWSSGQGQGQGQGQLWYVDGEGIVRSQLNDLAIESKDGGSWLCLAPYRGDSRQQWFLREGRVLANKVNPDDCICLEEGLMGTAVNADVIVTKYQARRHHHWVIEYV